MPPSPEVRSCSENPDGEDEDLEEMYEVEREIVLNEDDYNPEDDDDDDELTGGDDDAMDEENGFIPDDAVVTFTEHKDSVFCVDVNPTNNKQIISGGEDDRALIWQLDGTGPVIECDCHQDSVIAVGFSYDGRFASSVDMSGIACAWNSETGAREWMFECGDVEWANWHPAAPVLLIGCSSGDVYMFKIPATDFKICQSHGSKTTCGQILSDGKRLLAGYEDGASKMWDLKSSTSLFNLPAYDAPVSCVSVNSNGSCASIGFLDGVIRYVNETGKLLGTFQPEEGKRKETDDEEEEEGLSVEATCFSPDDLHLASAHINGSLFIWDLSTKKIRHDCKHPGGITKVIWTTLPSSESSVIITTSLDGIVRSWDWREGSMLQEWLGHTDHILDITISSNKE